jgi:putative membrane protein
LAVVEAVLGAVVPQGVGKMLSILTDEESRRLTEQIARVERSTAGELVTAICSRSSSYTAQRLGWSAALSWVLVVVIDVLLPTLGITIVFGLQLLLAIALYFVLGIAPLLRLITSAAVREQAVSDAVRLLFLRRGITETRERSGVLIFLSELERRVEILADRGISEHVGKQGWEALVTELTASIRDQKGVQGLTTAVERIGAKLATHFPPRADDTNELDNAVLTDGT